MTAQTCSLVREELLAPNAHATQSIHSNQEHSPPAALGKTSGNLGWDNWKENSPNELGPPLMSTVDAETSDVETNDPPPILTLASCVYALA